MAKEEKIGLTVKKEKNFSEWYTQVIQKAELADVRFGIQGFVVHKPWGFLIIRKIYEYLEEEIEKQGHLPFLFPTVVKADNLKKEKEHAGFSPDVFWITETGRGKIEEKFALRPTGEAQIYPMYALWFKSYSDLPFKGYQDRISVFRNEMTTRPFLRGREFLFFESHDVFYTHNEALKQIEQDLETCQKVIKNEVKIPFLYFKRPQWDKFKGAENTFTPDAIMPDGKRNQLASTHDLGQNFSKAFGIKVTGEDEKKHYAYQTCFGPGIWRIMAALIGIHGDDKGLTLPFDMAPIQVVIVPITFSGKEANKDIEKICNRLESKIKKAGYRVKFDDSNNTPGFKFNHWDLLGVPIRIEIGPKELRMNKLTIARRIGNSKKVVSIKDMKNEILKEANKNDKELSKLADSYLDDRIKEAKTYSELKNIVNKAKGFIKIPFCSVSMEGKHCADKLKRETTADISGTLYPNEDKVKKNQKCLLCGKEAKHIVYVAKSY